MSDAILGGPVPLQSDLYIPRAFANEVTRFVSRREWVLILGPRQHGKTSAFIRFKRDFRELGFECGSVDLQRAPVLASFEAFLEWFANQLARSLGREIEPPLEGDRGQVVEWLRQVVSPQVSTVILIDEASAIRDEEWRNAFYGQLRSLKNAVAEADDTALEARLVFVFAGTFDPETILHRDNSPFNIVQNIDTDDISEAEARAMAATIWGAPDDDAVSVVYASVGGQPFLLQLLFDAVAACPDPNRRSAVEAEIALLRDRGHEHLRSIFRFVISDPDLMDVVSRVLADGSAPFRAANSKDKFLQILGVMRIDGPRLFFRNNLYAHSARNLVQLGSSAQAAGLRTDAAVFDYTEESFDFVVDAELREIAFAAQNGAVSCHRGGFYRLALAGFGVALEAVLIDWLTQKGAVEYEAARTRATERAARTGDSWRPTREEDRKPPADWRLITLCKAAREVHGISGQIEIPEVIRDLRNCIHPAVMRERYRPEPELSPEANMSAAALAFVLRDLKA